MEPGWGMEMFQAFGWLFGAQEPFWGLCPPPRNPIMSELSNIIVTSSHCDLFEEVYFNAGESKMDPVINVTLV